MARTKSLHHSHHEGKGQTRLGEARRTRVSGLMGGPDGQIAGSSGPSTPAFDGLLVSWRPGATARERDDERAALGMTLREDIQTKAMRPDKDGALEWLDLPKGLSADAAIAALNQQAGVAYAEKNWLIQPQATSNDPYYTNGSLWGMYGDLTNTVNPYGSQAGEAWANNQTGSSSVYVGLIDEGYQYTHPDLSANAGTNTGEIAGNGIDDDRNGLIDDVNGWDFANGDNSVYDGLLDDHGTHVAGTIGAVGGNGIGVAGVNWNVKLLGAKFLGSAGGTIVDAVKAVDYFTGLKRAGIPIVATNNSWGGGGYSLALEEAIQRASAADILFIAAAGNSASNNDISASYPSNYTSPNVIAVAAIDSTGALATFSSYGATTVDLGAPGVGIWSTVPANSYASYSGTSMATPAVTGTAALLKSLYPTATGLQIKQALIEGTTATPSLTGKTVSGGRLDIPLAINRLGQIIGTPSTPLPVVSVSTTDANGAETGPDPGTFQLSLATPLTSDLTVNLAWQGSATNGADYTSQPATATILAGNTSVAITITPIDDILFEGTETATLRLTSGVGYTPDFAAASASVSITDNDALSEFWGTAGADTVTGNDATNIIGGVTKAGTDNGRGRIDTLIGRLGNDTYVLADVLRGTFYNDGNNRNQGTSDYAQITDFNLSQGDKLQLRSGLQYLIQNNGLDTYVYLGDGNNTFSASDELIARLSGVNLAPGTQVYILANIPNSQAWTSYV